MILAEIICDDVMLSVEAQPDGALLLELVADAGCRAMSIPRAALLPVREGLLRAWQISGRDPRQAVLPLREAA